MFFPYSEKERSFKRPHFSVSIRSKILFKSKIIFSPYSIIGHVNITCLKHGKIDTNQFGLSRPHSRPLVPLLFFFFFSSELVSNQTQSGRNRRQ